MSLKIGTDGLAGAQALGTAETQETQRANSKSAVGPFAAPGSDDTVTISPLSAQINDALVAAEVQAANRLAALSELYSSGDYKVDALELSRALVSHALRGGPEGGST
jgi:anti-sigma28 factor (negative regulator of flagellin synthesis)